MRKFRFAVSLFVFLAAASAGAQNPEPTRFQLAYYFGAYLPTGAQQDLLESDLMRSRGVPGPGLLGLSISYDLSEIVGIVASASWTQANLKDAYHSNVDLFQYDVGVQLQGPIHVTWFGCKLTLRPFIGAGLGARTYQLSEEGETDPAGYVTAGIGGQHNHVILGFAARDYVSYMGGLGKATGSSLRNDLANDVAVFEYVGLRF